MELSILKKTDDKNSIHWIDITKDQVDWIHLRKKEGLYEIEISFKEKMAFQERPVSFKIGEKIFQIHEFGENLILNTALNGTPKSFVTICGKDLKFSLLFLLEINKSIPVKLQDSGAFFEFGDRFRGQTNNEEKSP